MNIDKQPDPFQYKRVFYDVVGGLVIYRGRYLEHDAVAADTDGEITKFAWDSEGNCTGSQTLAGAYSSRASLDWDI